MQSNIRTICRHRIRSGHEVYPLSFRGSLHTRHHPCKHTFATHLSTGANAGGDKIETCARETAHQARVRVAINTESHDMCSRAGHCGITVCDLKQIWVTSSVVLKTLPDISGQTQVMMSASAPAHPGHATRLAASKRRPEQFENCAGMRLDDESEKNVA